MGTEVPGRDLEQGLERGGNGHLALVVNRRGTTAYNAIERG